MNKSLLITLTIILSTSAAFAVDVNTSTSNIGKYQDSLQKWADNKTTANTNSTNTAISDSTLDPYVNLLAILKSIQNLNVKLSTLDNNRPEDLNNLSFEINNISTQVEQLAIYTQGLSKSVEILADQLLDQKLRLESYVQDNIGNPVAKDSGRQGLVITAIIPDRVWFRTVKNKQMAVKLGENIPGYGKITSIDVAQGLVTTDLNITLRQFDA